MKTNRVLILVIVLLAAVGFSAGAAGISLEVGGVGWLFNMTGAKQAATGTPITNNPDISPDIYVNGSYTMAFDDSTKLKLGLFAEAIGGIVSPAFIFIGRAEPYADLSMGAFSARVSFPLYALGYDTTNDTGGSHSDALKYVLDSYYKGINLGTFYSSSSTTFLLTNYENIAYKLSFDKTTALTFSASTEIGFVPALWVYDVKPQVSLAWGMLQIDLKESIYFANGTSNSPSASDSGYNLRFFTDPKITCNFSDLGVKGLKAYIGASVYTYNNYPNRSQDAWLGGSNGSAVALGSSITPGVSYSFAPFYVEAAFKFKNYDDSVSNAAKKDPAFEPMIKISYTLSF
jgi:hypothetical protein